MFKKFLNYFEMVHWQITPPTKDEINEFLKNN